MYIAISILTGATRTPSGQELLLARQQTVLIAKAYRLQAIDMVHINFKGYPLYRSFEWNMTWIGAIIHLDSEGLRKYSLEGAHMGFTGKQCIHPSQVEIVQHAFTPSAEKIEWATKLITAFDAHQKSGHVRHK